jgi:hypothetical protein
MVAMLRNACRSVTDEGPQRLGSASTALASERCAMPVPKGAVPLPLRSCAPLNAVACS